MHQSNYAANQQSRSVPDIPVALKSCLWREVCTLDRFPPRETGVRQAATFRHG